MFHSRMLFCIEWAVKDYNAIYFALLYAKTAVLSREFSFTAEIETYYATFLLLKYIFCWKCVYPNHAF
jgi:hypothetical protein